LKTDVVTVTPEAPEPNVIQAAAEILRWGGLVAFPTETVYGLGADALNPQALLKIFAVKGRPADNPVIVHVAGIGRLSEVVSSIPEAAVLLVETFWPGPLTLVLPKSNQVPVEATGGLDTVAVRMPDNVIALRLIHALGRPIAAPSANLSGRPSPTAADHVYEDLNGQIEMILDGGPTPIGVESTVLDLTTAPPLVLRPGGVPIEELRPVIGEVVFSAQAEALRRSPGTRYRHYSPKVPLILIEQWSEDRHRPFVCDMVERVGLIGYVGQRRMGDWFDERIRLVELPADPKQYANRIFAVLRDLDQMGVEAIVVEGIEEGGLGAAVMDRLRRAASQII